jgi:aspartate aminotransferase
MNQKIVLAERMDRVNESATIALSTRAKQLAAEGKTIYNLTAGELAADTPEYIQAAVAKKLHLNKYTPVGGLPELRQAIAEQARTFYDLSWIKAENVVVTAASKPALYASLMALVGEGDEVILPLPAWVSHAELIKLTGAKVVPVSLTDTFDLDPEAILAKVSPRTKAIILNSPHNPTGAVFSKAALKRLAEGLQDTHVTVISDDMYAKLVYAKEFVPVPSAGFERVVIINGFSKSQALTGWRIGYAIAHTDIADAMISMLGHITGNASMPGQQAALAVMEQGDVPPSATIKTLKHQRQLVNEALKDVPNLKYQLPGGAFYYFLDVRSITEDSLAWCEQLLAETGVALVPGEAFGIPGFARLSFVTDEATLRAALDLIVSFVKAGVKT